MMSNKYKQLWPLVRQSRSMCINLRNVKNDNTIHTLSKYLNINETKAEYLCMRHPAVRNVTETKIKTLIETLYSLGYTKNILLEEPTIFSMLPVTVRHRYTVLQECGVRDIKAAYIVSYLTLAKQKSLQELKAKGIIPHALNVEIKLASYLSQWPISLTSNLQGDINEYSLYLLRLKMIQRYLELLLDLPEEKFFRGLHSYPTIKHRPLQFINETLQLLQTVLVMPREKIISNLYLLHADPDNLKQIIFSFRSIGGIDIKEILRLHPKLTMQSYSNMVKIKNILYYHGVMDEAQRRCFEIYTLSPETIETRIENSKKIPEFQPFIKHPRYLKMIFYNKKAMIRLRKLYDNNKKCSSLNILSGCSTDFEAFEKAPGDRLGKGRDIVFCVMQLLGLQQNRKNIHSILKRHPYWINIPLVQIQYVYKKLAEQYSSQDIYENCQILLYPWNKISIVLRSINEGDRTKFPDCINLKKLHKSQRLSLALYELEKHHYFSGNGVWSIDKNKYDVRNAKDVEILAISKIR